MKVKNTKKEIYYKCVHCKDEIFWDTQKRMTYCKCGKIAIDGCEYYVRIIGDEKDYKEIKKKIKIEFALKKSFVSPKLASEGGPVSPKADKLKQYGKRTTNRTRTNRPSRSSACSKG